MPTVLPRYPVYVPSKGRAAQCYTAQRLTADGVPFALVVEAPEAAAYAAAFPAATLRVLPFTDQGLIAARNWIKADATATGAKRHWQLDDNLKYFKRRFQGRRIPCRAGLALRVCEDFTDRYLNVALSGLAYEMFVANHLRYPAFVKNVHVYSATLILNALPHRWRLAYNDDTDLCLQVLAAGWCTLLLNAFMVWKARTMTVAGGNTAALYQGDGRLRMARALERLWPGVVTTDRRFQRPQHIVAADWHRFTTPLVRDPAWVPPPDPEYGMRLTALRPSRTPALQALVSSSAAMAPPPSDREAAL